MATPDAESFKKALSLADKGEGEVTYEEFAVTPCPSPHVQSPPNSSSDANFTASLIDDLATPQW